MRIAIGSDDRTSLTDTVLEELRVRHLDPDTYGALKAGDDTRWPEVARKVAEEVASGRCEQGVLFCHTGTGVSMAANKVAGVWAAVCVDAETARGARLWNDANILCMSLHLTSSQVAHEILDMWFSIQDIDESERENIAQVNHMDQIRSSSSSSHLRLP